VSGIVRVARCRLSNYSFFRIGQEHYPNAIQFFPICVFDRSLNRGAGRVFGTAAATGELQQDETADSNDGNTRSHGPGLSMTVQFGLGGIAARSRRGLRGDIARFPSTIAEKRKWMCRDNSPRNAR
jgi:hypothetical protein